MRESYTPLLELAVRHGFKELACGVSLPHTLAEVALLGYLSGTGLPPEQALRKLERKEAAMLGGREAHEMGRPGGERVEAAPQLTEPWMGGPAVPGMVPGGFPPPPGGPPVVPGGLPVPGAPPVAPGGLPVPGGPPVAPGGFPVPGGFRGVPAGLPPTPPAGFPFAPGAVSPRTYPPVPVPAGFPFGGMTPRPVGAPGLWDGFRPLDP